MSGPPESGRFGGPSRGTQMPPAGGLARTAGLLVAALAILLSSPPSPAAAQEAADPGGSPSSAADRSEPSVPAPGIAEAGGEAAGSSDPSVIAASQAGVPERAVAPRSLRPYWHVFLAFAVTWVLLFGYAALLGRRLATVERDLAR